jgi:hypothetical protein
MGDDPYVPGERSQVRDKLDGGAEEAVCDSE